MGDAEQVNPPRSGESNSQPSEADEPGVIRAAEDASEQRPASVPPSQGMVRRSSLRPAPADYRPSVRDPSTLRPMMVVRAGDAEPIPAHAVMVPHQSEQATQPPPPSSTHPDAHALTNDAPPSSDELELAIPPPPAVPIDLVATPSSSADDELGRDRVNPENGIGAAAEAAAEVARVSSVPFAGASLAAFPSAGPDVSVNDPSLAASAVERRTVAWRYGVLAAIGIAVFAAILAYRASTTGEQEPPPQAAARAEHQQPPVASEGASGLPESRGAKRESALAVNPAPELSSEAANPATLPRAAEPAVLAAEPAERQETTRVRLELKPIDAKVYRRGREVPGPPYEFEVAKDEKIAVEVVRFGFVTAKVVIDDQKPVIRFGMLRELYKKK